MFRFKMLTKVLVAVLFFGQLIELNVNLCIALSIERARPISRVKLYKSSQFKSSGELQPDRQLLDPEAALLDAGASFAAGRHLRTSSKVTPRLLKQLAREAEPQTGRQPLESTGTFDYFGRIRVGEPEREFIVLFDLTSSRFWLPSASCTSDACISRAKYNSSQSASYKAPAGGDQQPDQPIKLNYGNVQVEGRLCRDRVKFANFELDDVPFVEATQLEGRALGRMPVDGYFGLGFEAESQADEELEPAAEANATSSFAASASNAQRRHPLETPVEALLKRGLIEKAVFSLHLNGKRDERFYTRHSGDLILGEIDPNLFLGELTYVPVLTHPHENFWEFKLDGVQLNQPLGDTVLEVACESGCPAIVRTGVEIIGGHFDDVDRINRQMGGIPTNGIYFFSECDVRRLPDLVFTIGAQEFRLSSDDFLQTTVINGQIVECYSILQAIDAQRYPFWILGEPFLRKHYVVFDYARKQIGLAPSTQAGALELEESEEEAADSNSGWGRYPKGSIM